MKTTQQKTKITQTHKNNTKTIISPQAVDPGPPAGAPMAPLDATLIGPPQSAPTAPLDATLVGPPPSAPTAPLDATLIGPPQSAPPPPPERMFHEPPQPAPPFSSPAPTQAAQTYAIEPSYSPPAPGEYSPGQQYSRKEDRSSGRPWLIIAAAAAGLFVLLCAALVAVIGLPLYRGLVPAPAAGDFTATVPAPATLPPTPTPLPPSQTPRTALPALNDTDTPVPNDTPRQTPTRAPTDTSVPPTATAPTSFTVTIRNNTANPIYAFRDDRLMGTDPIPPAHYIFYKSIPPGPHTFRFCADIEGIICEETRQVNVDQDMAITVP
jgi:hypothetical protein